MKWRILLGLAALIAATAAVGLGVEVAVAGPGQAAGLAGVIAGFCELGAVLLGVAGWAAQHRAGGDRRAAGAPGGPDPDESGLAAGNAAVGAAGKYVVDARHARGVQVGDRNIQRNEFGGSVTAGEVGGAED
jgi:hypothetical protein